MAQGYYTLDDAAKILRTSPDELKQLARKGELRAFQDRGTWRFRVQDIDELARTRAAGSDPELPLGDLPKPRASDSPSPRTPAPKTREADVFHLADDDVGMGREPAAKSGSKSGKSGPKSPTAPPASDSEVRLVLEGDEPDSDVNLAQPKSPRPGSKPRTGLTPRPGAGPASSKVEGKKPSKVDVKGPASGPDDSDIRLVGMGSDSDVKLVGTGPADSDVPLGKQPTIKAPTDSDIRLELSGSAPPPSDEGLLTEEINLDEELLKAEAPKKPLPQSKIRPKTKKAPEFPTTSPFELSEEGLASDAPPAKKRDVDSSSDFDLTPVGESSSPVESGSDEFRLELDEEDIGVGKGAAAGELKGPSSGISLDNPLDSGISLEEESASSSDDFDLLTLDNEGEGKTKTGTDSEFELTLDDGAAVKASDPDSEFELTLDDSSGDLVPLQKGEDEGIFDTDFDVPELDESGSGAVAIDESGSDFDLALGTDDISIDEESGSQVVALDEDLADDSSKTVAAKRRKKAPAMDDDFGELVEGDIEEEIEEELEPVVVEKAAPAAPWGALPVAFLLPSVVVLFLVSVMGFEMMQSMSGYKSPGVITRTIGKLIDSSSFKN